MVVTKIPGGQDNFHACAKETLLRRLAKRPLRHIPTNRDAGQIEDSALCKPLATGRLNCSPSVISHWILHRASASAMDGLSTESMFA